jgi:hypothetical protein
MSYLQKTAKKSASKTPQRLVMLACVALLSACAGTKGTLQNPHQNTPLQAPVTVIHGWKDGYDLDTPDTENEGMHLAAVAALSKVDINANVRQATQEALEKQGIKPSFIDAPTEYNPRFDVNAPPEIAQVAQGSVLVVGVRPEVLCVTSSIEKFKGTQDPNVLNACKVVQMQYSVQHYSANGSINPPMVWRDTFKRDISPQSRCHDVRSCTQGAVDGLLTRLRNIGLF